MSETENDVSYRQFLAKMLDPSYLPTISMSELYENVYEKKPPIIDGLLYPGTYLFVGAPNASSSSEFHSLNKGRTTFRKGYTGR